MTRYDPAIPLHGDPDDWSAQDVETDEDRLVREQVERGLQLDQLVEDYREIAEVLRWSSTVAQDENRKDRLGELLTLVNGHARAAESLAAQQNVLRVA